MYRSLVGAALVTMIVACGERWPRQEPQPFPAGVYTFVLAESEVPSEVPPDIRPLMVGAYVITFTPAGRVSNVVSGHLDAAGHYASTPQYLVLTDEEGPGHCTRAHATGIYTWRRLGDQMQLALIQDECRWRAICHHAQALDVPNAALMGAHFRGPRCAPALYGAHASSDHLPLRACLCTRVLFHPARASGPPSLSVCRITLRAAGRRAANGRPVPRLLRWGRRGRRPIV